MLRRVDPFRGNIRLFSRWRWSLIGLIILTVVLFEFLEHRPFIGGRPLEEDFLRDILFYGIVSSFVANYILNKLERLSLQYDLSKVTYANLQKLIEQLAEAQDFQEASAIYIQSLRANLTISAAQLLVHNPSDGSIYLAASWPPNSAKLPTPDPKRSEQNCSLNKTGLENEGFSLTPCVCTGDTRDLLWPYSYCYPLTSRDRLLGILYLYHTEEMKLSAEQEQIMRGMAAEMVARLERFQLEASLHKQKASQATIQQRIARDMHATLGHNLAYLRMKLDQISTDRQLGESPQVNDLIQLRDTANETYQQMRDLLVTLTPEKTPNLRSTLTKYGQGLADRAGFDLKVQYSGNPRPLIPVVLQQVILIVREALGNIEKHAHAEYVVIRLDWQGDGLALHITDDGCGFDTNHPLSDEQFGIRFMQERASEVNGELILTSTIDSGTKISLWVPYQQKQLEE